jgi:cytochrome c oxidase subunit 3
MSISAPLHSNNFDEGWNDPVIAEKRKKTALQIMMAVITALFFLFTIAFLIRAQYSDYESLAAPWQPLANPWQLWLNSGILLLASISFHWAVIASRRENINSTRDGLYLAGFFTLVFLASQLWLWQQLVQLGYYVDSNPANSFFYLFTGLHGLHLIAGLLLWLKAVRELKRGEALALVNSSISICATYWHFLLVVWLFLFSLIMGDQATFRAIAAFCGF